MFNRAINAILLNNLLEFEESLTRSFQPLNNNNIQENLLYTIYKRILDYPCLLILLIYNEIKMIKSWTDLTSPFPWVNIRNNDTKILEQLWRHFTCLKRRQCTQIPQSPPRVILTSNRTKTTTIGLIMLSITDLQHGGSKHVITEKWFKNLIKSISAEKVRIQEKSIINIISRSFDITLMEKNDLKAEVIDLKEILEFTEKKKRKTGNWIRWSWRLSPRNLGLGAKSELCST